MAILTQEKRDVSVCGDFKTSGFKINASAKAFEILSSNIYTNKVRAVIREYSCNAYDAHVAAGNQDRQFDVNLPTSLDSTFSVRDYGIGLSEDQVRDIFTTYFQSTKTNSNDFIGALGLGSKSAFSLVDSFTVTSFFGGEKSVYSCYKDEHGEPQVALLGQSNTDEDNGVEISMSIPTDRINEFADEAVVVFSSFDKVPNVNNPKVVELANKSKDKYDFVAEGMRLIGSYYGVSLYARMGNVSYRIPEKYSGNLGGEIDFPIGSLGFNAGREELSMDDQTIELIEKRVAEVKETLAEVVLAEIENIDCAYARAMKVRKLRGSILNAVKNSKLYKEVMSHDLPQLSEDSDGITYYQRTSTWRSSTQTITGSKILPSKHAEHGDAVRYVWCKPRMKQRIQSWMKDKTVTVVPLTELQADFFLVPRDMIEDPEVLFPKLSRSTTVGGVTRSKVSVLNTNTSHWKPNSEKWEDTTVENDGIQRIYVEINRYAPVEYNFSQVRARQKFIDKTIYGLKTSFLKTKAFKDGNWISLSDYLDNLKTTLDKVHIMKYDMTRDTYRIAKAIKDMVPDNRFAELVDLATASNTTSEKVDLYRSVGFDSLVVESTEVQDFDDKLFSDYPMLKHVYFGWKLGNDALADVAEYVKMVNSQKNS